MTRVSVEVTVLGIAQDGGYPQVGCLKDCCAKARGDSTLSRMPVSLGLKGTDGSTHMIEASRMMSEQFGLWSSLGNLDWPPSSFSLTHAHLGHVDGLGLFGRETMSARHIKLHCSPSMHALIEATPAWNQLLQQNVFEPSTFPRVEIDDVVVEFISVPHRAELSDMHATIIRGREKSLLFLPDHDSWNQTLGVHGCDSIRTFLQKFSIDVALLDGTFWSGGELQGRDMSVVPHPTVEDSLNRLGPRRDDDPEIHFIHLNHTNPLYNSQSDASTQLNASGWSIGYETQQFKI